MTHRTAALGAALALTAATLTQAATTAPTDAARPGRTTASLGAQALTRLAAESAGPVRVTRGPDGLARVVGVSAGHDPAVTRATGVADAARTHLARYGALVGVADPGTTLTGGAVSRSVTGDDVVRFQQLRDGLPVVGGAVAVDLRPDRQLDSVAASVSRASVPPASYSAEAARQQALAVAAKRLGRHAQGLTADAPVRRLWDPAVFGVRRTSDPTTHARGVWWVDVHAGPGFHRTVLVDDRTGAIVQDLDQVEHVDRVVCDNRNLNNKPDVACQTADAVRVEGGPPVKNKDVDNAYDFSGVVARFYRQVGGLHLTSLLGADAGDHKSLSSTVRWCDPGARPQDCPVQNAFWNGIGMFYGQGFASADDVVGHEMTHGVISHNSDLFYWGQSGAMNESLADVMGEIIDHRHHVKGESRNNWLLGEDLPVGAIRSLKQPRRFGQPATMTSKRYARGQFDNGGVHTNSGIGNRTFYLISQGGRQGGRRIHGIDDRSLKRSATLALFVIQHLVSGSDYADLAGVLDHGCRSLARHHTAGFTRGDCRNVHKATLATRLRAAPRAKQPPDAPMTCPRGTGPVRVLFDSEKGTPTDKFDAGPTWLRAPDSTVFPPVAANAVSGRRSWFSIEPGALPQDDAGSSSLTMHPVALPVGRRAYLWFQQWRLLEFGPRTGRLFDAGTVEVADATNGGAAKDAARRRWVNGPHGRISGGFGNPAAGRIGFGGDSRGYLASRLALKHWSGHAVSPQFTMNNDREGADVGWYLDDVRVYACGHGPMPRTTPSVSGTAARGRTLTADPGQWSPSHVQAIQWYSGGQPIAGATGTTYVLQPSDVGKRVSVRVTATHRGRHTSTFSTATAAVTAH